MMVLAITQSSSSIFIRAIKSNKKQNIISTGILIRIMKLTKALNAGFRAVISYIQHPDQFFEKTI